MRINQKLGKRVICSSIVLMLGLPTLTGILGINQVHDNVPTTNVFMSTVFANEQGNQAFRQDVDNVLGGNVISDITLAANYNSKSIREKINQNKTTLSATVQSHYSDLVGHWAAGEFAPALYLGLIQGYNDGTIRPNANVKRSELSVMISKALIGNNPASEGYMAEQVMNTGGQSWFKGYWVSTKGLLPLEMTGQNMSNLYNGNATRAEVALSIAKTYFPTTYKTYYDEAASHMQNGNYAFPDITGVKGLVYDLDTIDYNQVVNNNLKLLTNGENEIPPNNYVALLMLKDTGIMKGDIDGNSMYSQEITRAEVVALVNRAIEYRAINGQ